MALSAVSRPTGRTPVNNDAKCFVRLMGWLTTFMGDNTIDLVEHGEVLRAIDIGISR